MFTELQLSLTLTRTVAWGGRAVAAPAGRGRQWRVMVAVAGEKQIPFRNDNKKARATAKA